MTTHPPFNPPVRLLAGPGPSNIDPRVLEAMQRPMLGHLDPVFHEMLLDLVDLLQDIYRRHDGLTLALSASGTSGMEAGLSALTEPGDKAIVAVGGFFGNRMAEIATRHGVRVVELRVPTGRPCPTRRSCRPCASTRTHGWWRSSTPRRRPASPIRCRSWLKSEGRRDAAARRLRHLARLDGARAAEVGRRLLLLVQPEVPGRASGHLAGDASSAPWPGLPSGGRRCSTRSTSTCSASTGSSAR